MPDSAWLHKFKLYVIATRPAFLTVTAVAVLLGWSSALFSGASWSPLNAGLTLLFALCAHAGANVLNDYSDSVSGCDEAPSERISPFTGGSQLIQQGRISVQQTRRLAYALLLVVIPAGLWLTVQTGLALLPIGMLGLFTAWAYSAPPFKLQSRGLGEWAIVMSWLLVSVGSDFVLSKTLQMTSIAASLGFAFLVGNILFLNQFPDIQADAAANKRTWIVRLGADQSRWGYALFSMLCVFWVGLMVYTDHLPTHALYALIPLPAQALAFSMLWRYATQPKHLAPAIRLTISSTLLHGLIMAWALWV